MLLPVRRSFPEMQIRWQCESGAVRINPTIANLLGWIPAATTNFSRKRSTRGRISSGRAPDRKDRLRCIALLLVQRWVRLLVSRVLISSLSRCTVLSIACIISILFYLPSSQTSGDLTFSLVILRAGCFDFMGQCSLAPHVYRLLLICSPLPPPQAVQPRWSIFLPRFSIHGATADTTADL